MDRALGCLLGVAVGDAAGATLEGRAAQLVPLAAARAAMRMPGSSVPYLGKGQVTDDTELTICLARGELDGLGSSVMRRTQALRQRQLGGKRTRCAPLLVPRLTASFFA